MTSLLFCLLEREEIEYVSDERKDQKNRSIFEKNLYSCGSNPVLHSFMGLYRNKLI